MIKNTTYGFYVRIRGCEYILPFDSEGNITRGIIRGELTTPIIRDAVGKLEAIAQRTTTGLDHKEFLLGRDTQFVPLFRLHGYTITQENGVQIASRRYVPSIKA